MIETSAPLHVVEVGPRAEGGRGIGGGDGGGDGAGGDDGAETFLLIHGYGASSYMWRHWTEPLARRGRVLLVDLKGFGSAPKTDDDRYAPDDLARGVIELVRELDLRSLTLVGQSLGGGVALLTALALLDEARSSDRRVRRMVLLAPAAYRQRLPPFVSISKMQGLSGPLLRMIGPRRVVRWVLRSIVHDPDSVTEDEVAEYARPLETREGRRAAFAAGRQILPPDIDERSRRYGELDMPTLLLWGESDRVIPLWVGERLEREMPSARLVVLEECGHVAPEERPEASWAVVERFLDRHPPGSG